MAASGSGEGAGSGSTKMGFGDAGSASSVGNIGVGGGVIMELSVDASGSGFEGEESGSSAGGLSDPARGLSEPRGLNDPPCGFEGAGSDWPERARRGLSAFSRASIQPLHSGSVSARTQTRHHVITCVSVCV